MRWSTGCLDCCSHGLAGAMYMSGLVVDSLLGLMGWILSWTRQESPGVFTLPSRCLFLLTQCCVFAQAREAFKLQFDLSEGLKRGDPGGRQNPKIVSILYYSNNVYDLIASPQEQMPHCWDRYQRWGLCMSQKRNFNRECIRGTLQPSNAKYWWGWTGRKCLF